MWFKVKKKNIIFHILYIIVAHLCSAFLKASIFTSLIVLSNDVCSDWPAIQCVVIGRIPQACDGNVTYCIVMALPIINEAFVTFSGE